MNVLSGKKNILVVDDDRVAHFLSEKVMASLGWINEIYRAFNGREGLKLLSDCCKGMIQVPNIILIDLHMPVMNGFEFIEAFQRMECMKGQQVLLAVLSSSENPEEHKRISDMGISNFIPKPISVEKLSSLNQRKNMI